MLAQQLCLKASIGTVISWTTRCDLDLIPYPNFMSNPFLDMLPNSPFISWIILLNDIDAYVSLPLNNIITTQKSSSKPPDFLQISNQTNGAQKISTLHQD
ncbi:hypothetical protein SLE2022_206230 [Rubroshorea leprosula]